MRERHEKRHRENPHAAVTNIVTYTPKPGREAELLALVTEWLGWFQM